MRRALVVGLNKYPENELRWCNNDATDMTRLLEYNGDETRNFDVQQIIETCSVNTLKGQIKDLFAYEADIALLYFSGHGYDSDGGYLVTTDYSSACMGVHMNDVLDFANNSPCKNRVIILDCCFSGKMGESFLAGNASVLKTGVTIMAASLPQQTAIEDPEAQHGVFTDLLIQGLCGGASDLRGNITPASLYSFVDQSLGGWYPRPVFKTNITEFLPIRKIKAKVPEYTLRKLGLYFEHPTDEYKLDPSYEFKNDPNEEHELHEPYADPKNVAVFKELQQLASVGLVEPVGEKHMYFAAMHSKACRLTPLGLHYWRLSKNNRL